MVGDPNHAGGRDARINYKALESFESFSEWLSRRFPGMLAELQKFDRSVVESTVRETCDQAFAQRESLLERSNRRLGIYIRSELRPLLSLECYNDWAKRHHEALLRVFRRYGCEEELPMAEAAIWLRRPFLHHLNSTQVLAYFTTTARNAGSKPKKRSIPGLADPDPPDVREQDSEDGSTWRLGESLRQRIRTLLQTSKYSKQEQAIWFLRHELEWRWGRIAAALKIKVSTARTNGKRLLANVAEDLGEEFWLTDNE